jgi:hypothetical protein
MSASSKETYGPRVFTKKVGDKTLTRNVSSVQGEVAAKFDGFLEQAPAKPSRPAAAAG